MIQRGINGIAYHWQRSILDIIYPPHCTGCGEPGFHWCPRCHSSLRIISNPICSHCGTPLTELQSRCQRCQEYPEILKVRSYAHYEGSLQRALISLKYRPNRLVARLMGGWLAELCIKEGWNGSMILPVPLGKKRMKQRGYNQAELITQGMSEGMGVPIGNKILTRIRETRSQVGLDPTTRFHNVQNAFHVDPQAVRNQDVFLVDDLLTTGATMVSCTYALITAGVRKVYGITVART